MITVILFDYTVKAHWAVKECVIAVLKKKKNLNGSTFPF